ncbi:hypothetical protein ACWDNT_06695 [Streptomyces sp. NPDC000963]
MYGETGVDDRVRAALFAHGIAFAPHVVHGPRTPGPGCVPAVPGC